MKSNKEMTVSKELDTQCEKNVVNVQGGSADTVYAVGLIGAWVYYISRATTPRDKFIGFLKGFAWPAILVHALLVFFEKDEA